MHPILNQRRRLAVYVVAWLLIGLLLALGFGRGSPWLMIAFFLPVGLACGVVNLSAWYVCRAFPLGERARVWTILPAHVMAAALTSFAWLGFAGPWSRVLDWLSGSGHTGALYAEQRDLLFVIGALLFWLSASFYYLLGAFEASRDAESRALALSLLAREAELKALRAQVDPHFIFNSLHSISALTAADPVAARRMCLLLADFLRDTLRLGQSSRIPLQDEIALADRFLAIEQVRFGSRLQVTRETDSSAMSCLVPSLLLQPLVENAVVHGISQLVDGGQIHLGVTRSGPIVTIAIENPFDPDRARSRGVGLGLELLRRRLATEFGTYDGVAVDEQGGRFRVVVRLPAVEG